VTNGLALGGDGRSRCPWGVGTPDYERYHDVEWGKPLRGDRALFERLTLEGFQSGLSWLTILRKRENFRAAFAGFDPAAMAGYGEGERSRLLADAGIVRHRGKIEAAINNAGVLLAWQEEEGAECLDSFLWSYAREGGRPRSLEEISSMTPASADASARLKKRGFRFVGPTTVYAAMQACGVVNDHLDGCEFG
jgi:DNA-3-methyladenine glycosylase I